MEARLDRSNGDVKGCRDLGQRHANEVVQDHDCPALLVEAAHRAVDEGSIRHGDGRIGSGRSEQWRDLDLDRSSPATPGQVETCVDSQAIDPGIEPVRIAETPQIPPGPEQSLLDRVARELRVPEDQAGCRVQPRDGAADKLGEGVMIAMPCLLDEPSLVHGHLAGCRGPGGRVYILWRRQPRSGSCDEIGRGRPRTIASCPRTMTFRNPPALDAAAYLERFAWHPEPELIGFRDAGCVARRCPPAGRGHVGRRGRLPLRAGGPPRDGRLE